MYLTHKVDLNLTVNEILVDVISLCYDKLLYLAQISTNLTSLHLAFNEILEKCVFFLVK